MMKLDLHIHSSDRSACGRSSETEQIESALAAGLDGIAFTDHHRLAPYPHLVDLNRKYAPFKIYSGIEITADHEDWLVLGIQDPALESELWDYEGLHRLVRQKGGIIVLAHPYRYQSKIQVDLNRLPPDAIELRSRNTPAQYEGLIREAASLLNLLLMCNSDAHYYKDIGAYYNEIPGMVENDAGLVRTILALKSARLADS
jgi:predicted metal-dependent phosphoesterase TrpH